ncbi:MAG: hypothetical protein RL722_295 [Pseudomonadota bacterium]|jgi:hypothetical protein
MMMKRLSSPGGNLVLVGSAVLAGWWAWGWQGLVLAITLIVFWALLQFRRATRALELAARRPVGSLDSIVMLQSRLDTGMQMAEVLALTGSLGIQQGHHDDWLWRDAAGDEIVLSFRRGVLVRWAVARQDSGPSGTVGL